MHRIRDQFRTDAAQRDLSDELTTTDDTDTDEDIADDTADAQDTRPSASPADN